MEEKINKVLYPGNLPVFGAPGYHPQFEHLNNPPEGYKFIHASAGRLSKLLRLLIIIINWFFSPGGIKVKLEAVLRFIRRKSYRTELQRFYNHKNTSPDREYVHIRSLEYFKITRCLFATAVKLLINAKRKGAKLRGAVGFLLTRDILSQLMMPVNVKLAFLPSFPCILGQIPWVVEIEDPLTLFIPFVHTGFTSGVKIHDISCYSYVKALIEDESCRGIICHVKSTAEALPVLFDNDELKKKIFYIPIGVSLPSASSQVERRSEKETIILFTNSWHQSAGGFYMRGGLDLLEAFSILASKYTNIKMILRTALPGNLDERYLNMIKNNNIEVIDYFLPAGAMEDLLSGADIYALPAARLHVVSTLKAMAHGLAVLVSDGWGFEDYIEHGRNGLTAKGRYGKCSWMDRYGMLREDYKPLFESDPVVADSIADNLSLLIENPVLRKKLGDAARRDVETRFSIDNWNKSLSEVFCKSMTS